MIISIQKKGRLGEESLAYLNKIGYDFSNKKNTRHDYITVYNNTVLFLRYSDIFKSVEKGVADCGIIGSDTYEEYSDHFNGIKFKELNFSKNKIVLATNEDSKIRSAGDLENKIIATEFPVLSQRYLNIHGVGDSQIYRVKGSCEVYCYIGFADAIIDIVETGATLEAYGMKILDDIYETQALLIYKNEKNLKDLLGKIA